MKRRGTVMKLNRRRSKSRRCNYSWRKFIPLFRYIAS